MGGSSALGKRTPMHRPDDNVYTVRGNLPPREVKTWARAETVITTFEAGHPFVAVNAFTSNLADTSDFVTGKQSAMVQTNGDGTVTSLRATGLAPTDMRGRIVKVRVKCSSNYNHLKSITLRAGDTVLANSHPFPIYDLVLSHGVGAQNQLLDVEWYTEIVGYHSFGTETGTPNRAAVTDWSLDVVDDGFGKATVRCDGISVVENGGDAFPNGVLVVTFDDSYASVWNYARPALDKWGDPAVIYPIMDSLATAGRMTIGQIKTLRDVLGWDIGSHAYTQAIHDAIGAWTLLDQPSLDTELLKIKAAGADNGFGQVDHVSYPQGFFNATTISEVGRWFATARTTNHLSYETLPPANSLRLRGFSVHNSDTPASVQSIMDNGKTHKSLLILAFHKIVLSPSGISTEYVDTDFAQIIDYAHTIGMPIMTIGQVMAHYAQAPEPVVKTMLSSRKSWTSWEPTYANTNWNAISVVSARYTDARRTSTGAQNASITPIQDFMPAGAYSMTVVFGTGTDRGIATVYVDGVSVGTIDMYAASAGAGTPATFTIRLSSAGQHTVSLVMTDKNASSTNYVGELSGVSLIRTGD